MLRSKAFLVCAGMVVGVLLAEIATRVLGLAALPAPRRVVYAGRSWEWCCGPEILSEGVHRFLPDAVFSHCYVGGSNADLDAAGCVTYRINRWGYRGADFARDKPAGTFRIVIIGDSFTFGEGTPLPLIYPTLLATAVREHRVDSRAIEIINLGIPGESTESELVTYRTFATTLKPDWVIVQWNTNDFPSLAVARDHLRLIGKEYRALFSDIERYRWSHLLTFAYARIRMRQLSRELIATTRQEAENGQASFDRIGEFRELTRQDHAGFTLLIFPELIRFDDYPYATILDALREYCRAQQISFVDLLPALSTRRDRELWVHEADHHPNRLAHAMAAHELAKRLDLRSP